MKEHDLLSDVTMGSLIVFAIVFSPILFPFWLIGLAIRKLTGYTWNT